MRMAGIGPQFDDRRAGGEPTAVASTSSDKPPVLRRWTIRLFGALGILGITYGTLAPFQIDPGRSFTWQLLWDRLVPGDAIANVLIYIPVGICFRLLVRRRGSWWPTECLLSLLLAAGLSYLTEACQTVLAFRVPSWVDWCCNVTGATIGQALAPVFQRLLRNQHAWLYNELRARPFCAAGAATIILVTAAALMPFDVQPTPAHVAAALHRVRCTTLALPWTAGEASSVPLEPVQVFDKMTAAACYGLVAFLMAVGQCELGRRRAAAVWFAMSRTIALVAAIELLQLFTVTHTADPRDLVMGWLFSVLGAGVAWSVLSRSADGLPLTRRPPSAGALEAASPAGRDAVCQGLPRPVVVLRGLVMVLAVGVAGRAVVAAACMHGGSSSSAMNSWLPMAASFQRPWPSLLGEYLTTLLQYALLAGLLVLWSRADRRRPNGLIVGTIVALAWLAGQIVGILAGRPIDTAGILLALLASWLAVRLDRALFGRFAVAHRTTQAGS